LYFFYRNDTVHSCFIGTSEYGRSSGQGDQDNSPERRRLTLDEVLAISADVISGFSDTTRLQALADVSYTDQTRRKRIGLLSKRAQQIREAEMRDCTTWVSFVNGLELDSRTRKELVETLGKGARLRTLDMRVKTVGHLREIAQDEYKAWRFSIDPRLEAKVSPQKREYLLKLFGKPPQQERK